MFICPCRTQVSFWPMVIARRSYTKKRGRMKNTLRELLQRVSLLVLFVGLLHGVS